MIHGRAPLIAAAFAGCAALLVTGAASAQSSLSRTSWRQSSRHSALDEDANASPQSFAFEARFGPYYPQVDDEFGGTGPYHDVFGDGAQFYFGFELDWLPLRIPYVGVVGPGFGWGYTTTSADAKITGSDEVSDAETSLTIMPMHLSAVARFDELMRRTGIPVVPYVKFGIGLGTWNVSLAGETVVSADGVEAEDTTWGTHFALGGMLCLNFLDRRASAQLDDSTGVNHAYLFGEWMNANLSGIGSRPQMHIGSSSWVLGLAFDM